MMSWKPNNEHKQEQLAFLGLWISVGAVAPTVGRIKVARVVTALNQGVFSLYFVVLKSNPVTKSRLDENSSLLYS